MKHRRIAAPELADSLANGEELQVGNHPLDMPGATRIESAGAGPSQNSCGRYDPFNVNVNADGRAGRAVSLSK